jgi:succinate dehydrogenase / fumarate reductase cytochrome b subunit
MSPSESPSAVAFFFRHEFAIRRLHSLLGIVPLGLYMVVHLTTNASLMNGPSTFQRAVYLIHSPGKLLPLIEWGGIFLPLIFHAVLGVWIARTGKSNDSQYRFASNRRYSWQRWTGFVALVFLFFHILHLHGWFHAHFWLDAIANLGFGVFRPYNAASTLVLAMQGWFWPAFYLIGVLCCVYHLANGLWTAGITWGLWISPAAQQRATKVCAAFGILMAIVGTSAWWAAVSPGREQAAEYRQVEDTMYRAAVDSEWVPASEEKRSESESATAEASVRDPDLGPTH